MDEEGTTGHGVDVRYGADGNGDGCGVGMGRGWEGEGV